MSIRFSGSQGSLERYLSEIANIPLLSREEEIELAEKSLKGDKPSRQKLVSSNLRLVVKIALDYVGMGVPVSDLISEGNLGLVRAAELYNPNLGTKFSTYAALWIKQRIRRAITNQSRAVRIPIWKSQLLRRMNNSVDALTTELGRAPTENEIAEDLGLEQEDITKLKRAKINVSSLDASVSSGDDNDASLIDLMMDEKTLDPASELTNKDLLEEAVASLDILSDKELKILSLRFGLNGEKEETLDAIGARFHVSRERIRQLQEIALTKLRRSIAEKEKKGHPAPRKKIFQRVTERIAKLVGAGSDKSKKSPAKKN